MTCTESPVNAALAPQHFRRGLCLHGLAQAHVIGQNYTAAASGEDSAHLLVGQ